MFADNVLEFSLEQFLHQYKGSSVFVSCFFCILCLYVIVAFVLVVSRKLVLMSACDTPHRLVLFGCT